ncbi:MAG: hypothetical protein ACREOZ_02825, partial [Gloeomargaritales cyanobacterium]
RLVPTKFLLPPTFEADFFSTSTEPLFATFLILLLLATSLIVLLPEESPYISHSPLKLITAELRLRIFL